MSCTLGDTNILLFALFLEHCWSCMEWVSWRWTGKVVLRSNHKYCDTRSHICAPIELCNICVWEGQLATRTNPYLDIDGIHIPCTIRRRKCGSWETCWGWSHLLFWWSPLDMLIKYQPSWRMTPRRCSSIWGASGMSWTLMCPIPHTTYISMP